MALFSFGTQAKINGEHPMFRFLVRIWPEFVESKWNGLDLFMKILWAIQISNLPEHLIRRRNNSSKNWIDAFLQSNALDWIRFGSSI